MFFYYPLGAAGGGGGGALTIEVRPDPAEYYKPSVYYSATVDVTSFISGGVAPYTVEWAYVSGDTEIYPASFTTTDNTFIANNDDAAPHVYQAVWQATVTDADSNTASDTVNLTLAFGTGIP